MSTEKKPNLPDLFIKLIVKIAERPLVIALMLIFGVASLIYLLVTLSSFAELLKFFGICVALVILIGILLLRELKPQAFEIGVGGLVLLLAGGFLIGVILGYIALYTALVFHGLTSFVHQLLFDQACYPTDFSASPPPFNQPICQYTGKIPGADAIYSVFVLGSYILFFAIPRWVYESIKGKMKATR